MFRTRKFRTTIAVLAAASSVAVSTGPITPAAQATKNNHAYQKSSEAGKKKVQNWCNNLQKSFQGLSTTILTDLVNNQSADAARDIANSGAASLTTPRTSDAGGPPVCGGPTGRGKTSPPPPQARPGN